MRARTLGVAVLLICFVLIGGYIWVDSIAVQSSSPEQTSGFTSNCGPACRYNLGPIPDWTGTGFGGSLEASGFFGPVPDGSHVGFIIIVPLSQDLDVAQTPEQNHTFAVFVGDQPDVDLFIWPISLNTGDAVGTFEQEASTFSTDSPESTFPSGSLTFPLTGGSPANTDRPTVSTPEPAAIALLATGLFFVALFGWLYKGKQAIQKVA